MTGTKSNCGRIFTEYALGRKRTDLLIQWPPTEQGYQGPIQTVVIELKIQHQTLDSTIKKGLKQTFDYCEQVGAQQAHLVIFNRSADISWQDRIWHQSKQFQSHTINVWGC